MCDIKVNISWTVGEDIFVARKIRGVWKVTNPFISKIYLKHKIFQDKDVPKTKVAYFIFDINHGNEINVKEKDMYKGESSCSDECNIRNNYRRK